MYINFILNKRRCKKIVVINQYLNRSKMGKLFLFVGFAVMMSFVYFLFLPTFVCNFLLEFVEKVSSFNHFIFDCYSNRYFGLGNWKINSFYDFHQLTLVLFWWIPRSSTNFNKFNKNLTKCEIFVYFLC